MSIYQQEEQETVRAAKAAVRRSSSRRPGRELTRTSMWSVEQYLLICSGNRSG